MFTQNVFGFLQYYYKIKVYITIYLANNPLVIIS